MNEIKVWNYDGSNVRTIEKDGEPWFVGKDVADVLGYTNTQKAIRDHVDEEDKLTERIVLSGQNREAILINESGLYSLILSSKLPDAKKFKRWVTSDVLPSIRKTGSYGNMTQMEMIAMIASNAVKLEKKQLELENKMNEQNDLLNEAVDAIDTTTKSVEKIENAFENVKEAIVLDRKEWRKETKSVIMKIAKYIPDEFENSSSVYYKLYKLLEKRAGVNLNTRLKNMKERMRKAGVSSTKVCNANKLDVIAEDPKLIEIFVGIVKELAMKTGLNLNIDF